MASDSVRVCRACELELPITAFEIDRGDHRRSTCRVCRLVKREVTPRVPPKKARFHRAIDGTRFIITSAQDHTEVDSQFFAALQVAADYMGAELIVIPYRYKNPTGWRTGWKLVEEHETAERWPEEVRPYLYNQRKKLGPNLVLAADVRVQATASSPLSGFEGLTGAESCIIGHPKMQLRSIPVPNGRYAKILSTTGTCTKRNLSETKAGALAKFHHFLGAIIVELEGKHFHLRQVNADRETGGFIDLDKQYTADGVTDAPPALGLVLGDTHVRMTSKSVENATFGDGGIVDTLNPQTLVWHDVLDGYSVNPHHIGNPFVAQAKFQASWGDVRAEVEEAIYYIAEKSKGRKSVIVPSNHDNFLSRWIINSDWRQQPANAKFYLETALAMLESVKMGAGGAEYADPFKYWVDQSGHKNIHALKADESCVIGGVEVGQHGDHGPNGARGTMKNLARLGARMTTGHDHTGGIEEGHYKVGTSTPLKLEYTRGPSSWQNMHCVIYANGKRALITIVDEKWRGS